MLNRLAACILVVALPLLLSLNAYAQIKSGEYVLGTGYGTLRITPDTGGALRFQLDARGANFHSCELSGVMRNGESRMEDSADQKLPCIVTFKPEKNGIAVASKHDGACAMYCGARAHFEGTYAMPPAGCAPSHVRQTRNRFKAAYDKKLFADARAMLSPMAEKCASVLSQFDQGWVSNDLALTHYRAGDSAACHTTLKPWLELAQTPDDQIRGDYPPSDAAEMLRIAQATRANLKICGALVVMENKGGKDGK